MGRIGLVQNIIESADRGPDIDKNGIETMRYDIPGFEVFARRNHILAGETFPEMRIHWHDDIEIVFVRSGRVTYRVNNHIIRLKKGEGLMVNCRQMHIMISEDTDYDIDCVIFNPKVLCSCEYMRTHYVEPVINDAVYEYLLFDATSIEDLNIADNVARLVELYFIGQKEPEVLGALFGIWHDIYNKCETRGNVSEYHDDTLQSMKTMLEYIYMKYDEKITIDDICKAGKVGKSICSKMFNNYTNYSPIEFVRQFRIVKSKEFLRNTDMSITEISYKCGFNNASFFTETFRQINGMTPGEYRKMH